MLIKLHNSPNGIIVAICDKELINKKFTQGKLQLDLTTSFYKGEEMPEEKVLELIKRAYIINLVGKKSIDFALKNKLIGKEHIVKIKNIPICQCIIIKE